MSGIGKTKNDIVKMLTKRQHTLTEISQELGLSPSTVKQHIDELQQMGAITPVENEFIKRWKYYRATPNFEIGGTYANRFTRFTRINPYYVGSILLIIGMAAVAYTLLYNAGNAYVSGTTTTGALLGTAAASAPTYSLAVRLTDPPTVPEGTNALVMNYSSVALEVSNNGGASGWVNVSGSGSVDPLSLVNVSQLIGSATLSANDIITGVRLEAASSFITIGNASYSVFVPENSIIANIKPVQLSSNSVILADFSPVIVSVYSSNATTFLLVPSVKAVVYGANVIGGSGSGYGEKDNRTMLTPAQEHLLENASASVLITGESISSIGGNTALSVTVKNMGNRPVTLHQLQISGPISSHVLISSNSSIDIRITNNDSRFPSGEVVISRDHSNAHGALGVNANLPSLPDINSSMGSVTGIVGDIGANGSDGSIGSHSGASGNVSASAHDNGNSGERHGAAGNLSITGSINETGSIDLPLDQLITGMRGNAGAHGHESMSFPAFSNLTINSTAINVTGNITLEEELGASHAYLRQLTFLVNSSGALVLPSGSETSDGFNGTGYVLASGASVTLTFNGSISYGNGKITDTLISGSAYGITIMGDPGVLVRSNGTVTAS